MFPEITKKLKSERVIRLSKEGIWIVLGQAMAVLGSLVGVRILTGLLNPSAYGELALGMTIATLVNQTLLGPLGNGVARFYAPAVERGELDAYLSAVRRLLLLTAGFILLVIPIAVIVLFLAGQMKWIVISFAALFFAVLSGVNLIIGGIQNAARKRSIVALHQGIQPWLQCLFAGVLLLWLGTTSTIAMVGYLAAIAVVLGSQYFFFQKTFSGKAYSTKKTEHWRANILKYSWPFTTWGVFTWVQLASDRWALGLFSTMKELGMYAVLFQLGYYPISIATGVAVQLLAPIYYQRAGDGSDHRRNANVSNLNLRLIKLALGLTGLVFLLTLAFHLKIFQIFAAKDYQSASYLLPWLILAGGVFASGQILALNLMSQMKTHSMMVAKITSSLLGVTFNFTGAYWYGIEGIVIANILFSFLTFIWMILLSIKPRKTQRN